MTDLAAAVATVRTRLGAESPSVGVVLGSGLGGFVAELEEPRSLAYREIPGMPTPSVAGHHGELVVGTLGAARVACLRGRVHLYEGRSTSEVCFGVRLLAEQGCRAVLLTNAAGGIAPSLVPGELMAITDHLNLMGRNPLIGVTADTTSLFIDMSTAYDPSLLEHARAAASELGVHLHEGVYAAVHGPSYETPAEVRMLRTLGADAVGMSTVPEVIALRHLGVRTGALSCITNHAAGLSATPLAHAEVTAIANAVRPKFQSLLSGWIRRCAAARA
jgi:purine-nucleoside phosphorylase